MMLLPKGTLVRVKESALDDGANSYVNGLMTTENGWLWFVDHLTKGPSRFTYECRALATGHKATWFDYEIEVAKEEENEHPAG